MLGICFLLAFFIDLSLADFAYSVMTIGLCLIPMEIRQALLDLARLARFSYRTLDFNPLHNFSFERNYAFSL